MARIKMRVRYDHKRSIWHATCSEDKYVTTGWTENEAMLSFAGHLSKVHPNKQVKKV